MVTYMMEFKHRQGICGTGENLIVCHYTRVRKPSLQLIKIKQIATLMVLALSIGV